MKSTTLTNFRTNLRAYSESVINGKFPLFVSRLKGEGLVVLAQSEYNTMKETLALLSNPNYNKKQINKKVLVDKYLVKSTFWDADFEKLDLENDKGYIISRIVERGTDKEVEFVTAFYAKEDVLAVVNNAPEITPKTKNYFNTIVYESC